MSEQTATKGGKKNRKHNRSLRSPAMKRYNAERRDLVNKARHVAQALRRQDKARRKRIERDARRLKASGWALKRRGYNLDELERDNPYNAWMYEGLT